MKLILFLLAAPLFAAQIPAGTELSVRIIDKLASETAKPQTPIHAVVIAAVVVEMAAARVASTADITTSHHRRGHAELAVDG